MIFLIIPSKVETSLKEYQDLVNPKLIPKKFQNKNLKKMKRWDLIHLNLQIKLLKLLKKSEDQQNTQKSHQLLIILKRMV